MKKLFISTLAGITAFVLLVSGSLVTAANGTVSSPYGSIEESCITNIEMESRSELLGGIDYFSAVVTSHIQGLEERAAIPYRTFAAVGNENTKMFVYSIGSEDNLGFSRATTKQIVERFEAENPEWDAVVAINGDFFDIETAKTADMGEPEFPMIQMGDAYKFKFLPECTGRGVVGTTADGEMIYYTVGSVYKDNGYGTPMMISNTYSLQILGEHRTNAVAEYPAYADFRPQESIAAFITPNSQARDFLGATVYEVKCDTYRRTHIGLNGGDIGTTGYFIEGEIVNVRDGKANELPKEGYVYIATKNPEDFSLLEKGTYLKCQKTLSGKWEGVTNAIGFKQQILANGTQLLKNCYGTYNPNGDQGAKSWTEDVYDYPYCWKDRTAIGFRKDGTPVLLVLKKSLDSGSYKNLGASYYEISAQMKALGCVDGFLLDGGGSSTFVIRNEDGTFSNAHVGEGDGRAVANAVILAVRDESVPDPVLDEKKQTEKDPTNPTEPETNPGDVDDNDDSDTAKSVSCKEVAAPLTVLTIAIATAVAVTLFKKRKKT